MPVGLVCRLRQGSSASSVSGPRHVALVYSVVRSLSGKVPACSRAARRHLAVAVDVEELTGPVVAGSSDPDPAPV